MGLEASGVGKFVLIMNALGIIVMEGKVLEVFKGEVWF
jgi:hypothetical protein